MISKLKNNDENLITKLEQSGYVYGPINGLRQAIFMALWFLTPERTVREI